jgi:hypothetical protein
MIISLICRRPLFGDQKSWAWVGMGFVDRLDSLHRANQVSGAVGVSCQISLL